MISWVRAHLVLTAGIGALALVASAAAWSVIYSGASGGGNGAFAQQTHALALTFTSAGGGTAVTPCTSGSGATCTGGTPGVINVTLTNNDPDNAHAAVSPTVTLTASPTSCAAYLYVTGTSGLTQSVAAGGTGSGSVTFVADPTTPLSCAGGSVTASISATTS